MLELCAVSYSFRNKRFDKDNDTFGFDISLGIVYGRELCNGISFETYNSMGYNCFRYCDICNKELQLCAQQCHEAVYRSSAWCRYNIYILSV